MSVENAERLKVLRDKIDEIDGRLVALLNARATVSVEVGTLKAGATEPVFKPFREKEVLDKLKKRNSGPMPDGHLEAVYREILSSSRRLQRPDRVVYLGPEGTFSFFAGLEYLGHQADMVPKEDFEGVFKSVTLGEAELGVIPLENSLQGTVGQCVDLFLRYPVYILAELYFRVSHCLLGRATSLHDIHEVHSHPKALDQCGIWLKSNLGRAKTVPVESTAAAARKAAGAGAAIAAVGNARLAEMCGLSILADRIEDLPDNWTRFLIIGPNPPGPGNRDKTSVLFSTPDRPGALANILNLLAQGGINLTKLESRPISGERWKYVFFADLQCDLGLAAYESILSQLKDACQTFKILGSYPAGPYLDGSGK